MNKKLLFFLLVWICVSPVAAQGPVPIEKEPMHRLKFENEFVRVFDVLIPAGSSTLFHTHIYDGVSVRLSDTQLVDEVSGGPKVTAAARFGEAAFSSRPAPMTHRVSTAGAADYRNIFIELLKNAGGPGGTYPVLTSGHIVLLENERIRVSKLVLKPGRSSAPHRHPLRGIGVILRDARAELSSPGSKPRILEMKAGDFVWQEAGTTHTIRNLGRSNFEAIDIEIK